MDHFPRPAGRQLTLEVFDHYVAKARAERAKAIAAFGGQVARWLGVLAARLMRRTGAGAASKPVTPGLK